MTNYSKQPPDQEDMFLKAMGTFFLFGGVILLDQLIGNWFPNLKFINAFSTFLVVIVWAIFVYFCIRFYRAKKFVAATTIPFQKSK